MAENALDHLFDEAAARPHVRDETLSRLDDRHDPRAVLVVVVLKPVTMFTQLVPVVAEQRIRPQVRQVAARRNHVQREGERARPEDHGRVFVELHLLELCHKLADHVVDLHTQAECPTKQQREPEAEPEPE